MSREENMGKSGDILRSSHATFVILNSYFS